MVNTNGFPKHGNHALVKAVQLLGVPCSVDHIPYSPVIAGAGKNIFVKRDPRNALVSWLRFKGRPVTQGMFLTAFADFGYSDLPLVDAMAQYEGWLTDPNTLVVRFEDLIANDTAIRGIADYLGVPYLADAFTYLLGGTLTWTGTFSDYTAIWTADVEAAWIAGGGADLMTRWGY